MIVIHNTIVTSGSENASELPEDREEMFTRCHMYSSCTVQYCQEMGFSEKFSKYPHAMRDLVERMNHEHFENENASKLLFSSTTIIKTTQI